MARAEEDGNSEPSGPHAASSIRQAGLALLPLAAALLALGLHRVLPNRQSTLPTRLYPQLLQLFAIAALLFPAAAFAGRRPRAWAVNQAPLWAAAIAALCLWDFITLKQGWMPLPYFPGPDLVLQGLVDDRQLLLESTWQSLKLLVCGYALGVVLGFVSGILMGWFRRVRYWGMPVLKFLGPVPATALVPLAMTFFANPFFSGTALIALAVWFPVTMLTTSGISNVPASYFDVARTLGAGRRFLIFHVAVPAALPSVFIGLFMGLSASFLTLIVAETVGVRSGLGWYLKWQQGYAEYAKVYAALLIMAVFFSGVMTLLFKARDRMLVWQKGAIRW